MFKHSAKVVVTQATSVSLNMFKHTAKAMATQAISVSLNMFRHTGKAMATQAIPRNAFSLPDPRPKCNKTK